MGLGSRLGLGWLEQLGLGRRLERLGLGWVVARLRLGLGRRMARLGLA